MITVKLQGGLGNQMFQYAFGRAVSSHKGVPLLLDISWYKNSPDRRFLLTQFNIRSRIATDEELEKARAPLQKVFDLVRSHKHFIVEKSPQFDPTAFKVRTDSYLDGYWQNERYFDSAAQKLLGELSLKDRFGGYAADFVRVITNSENPVSIHIRRGDYLANPKFTATHGVLPLSYYEKAMALIEEKVENPRYFLFSDDPEWAQENILSSHKIEVISDPRASDIEELHLMSLCKHHIIANSTFSWWGAWLNQNPDKIVLAPERWFTDPRRDSSDIIPTQWIKI